MLFDSLEVYDPQKVDMQYVQQVASKIPKDGHIDLNVAEQLAMTFLQCADSITDEIARCAAYCGKCEAERREAKAFAIDNRINGIGGPKVAATVAIQLFGSDPTYKSAHDKQAIAEAFLEWLRTKYKNLMAAHVMCKDVMKIHQDSISKGTMRTTAHPHDIDREPDSDITRSEGDENDANSPAVGPGQW